MRRIMLLPAFYMNTRAIPLDRSICALLPIHRQIQKTYPPDHRHPLHRQKPALLLLQKLPSKRKFLMQMPVPAHRHVPPLPKGISIPFSGDLLCSPDHCRRDPFSPSPFSQEGKEDLLLRRKRRLERLEDIGYSSSDFDQLLSQKRSSTPAYKSRHTK